MITLWEEYAARLLEEDLGLLDVTVMAMGIGERPGRIECAPKEDCVVAGVELAASVLGKAGAKVHVLAASGTVLSARTPCLEARGSARQLHVAYKVAQNVMEYASGIATRTAEMLRNARSIAPKISLCVTRKHFPGGKALSLSAAMAGGAVPHRLGFSDSILAFDQHRPFLRPGNPWPMWLPPWRRDSRKRRSPWRRTRRRRPSPLLERVSTSFSASGSSRLSWRSASLRSTTCRQPSPSPRQGA